MRKSYQGIEAYYEPDHPNLASTLCDLCVARLALNEDSHELMSDLTRAKTIFESHYGFEHPHTELVSDLLLSLESKEQSCSSRKFSFFHDQEEHSDDQDSSLSRSDPGGSSGT